MKSANTACMLVTAASLTFGAPTSPVVARDACEAPYQQNDGAYKGHYIVAFAKGYTLDDHFKLLGGAFTVEGTLDEGCVRPSNEPFWLSTLLTCSFFARRY